MSRNSKLVSASEAVAEIRDGMSVGIGGWIFNSQPMALVREIVRRRVRNLTLIPAPGSMAPDLLIGAGCVSTCFCVFISFEQFGLAPCFRRAAEAGDIVVREFDGPGIAGGLRAAACDLDFMPVPDLGTDLPRVNPESYQPMEAAASGRPMLKVPAVHPDVVLLHAQQADEAGNIQYTGAPFFDRMLAQAGRKVIVSVDRIVDTATIRANARQTLVPSCFVHAVVEAPKGAHPTASAGLYRADETHLAMYAQAAVTPAGFAGYLDTHVHGLAEQEYLTQVAGGLS